MLGLLFIGTNNQVQAAQAIGKGKEMGHGPVANSSGKGERFDEGHKRDKDWYQDRNSYSYRNGYPSYCISTETCEQPVCDVPFCPASVFAPAFFYEPVYCYETYRSYEYREPWYDYCYSRHWDRPMNNSKGTTASSHRTGENLGSTGPSSKGTTASSHRTGENLGSMGPSSKGTTASSHRTGENLGSTVHKVSGGKGRH
jgi:hypothetical protein